MDNNAHGTLLSDDAIRLQRMLPGPIDRVWRYLTESDLRRQWLAEGSFPSEGGGTFALTFRNRELTDNDDAAPEKYARFENLAQTHGRVLDCSPPNRLVITWDEDESSGSEVTFELQPDGDEVLLTLTHQRLPSRNALLSVASGWHAHLGILLARLTGTEPDGFWRTHTRLEAEYGRLIPTAPAASN